MNVTGANEQENIVCENGGSPAGDYCSCPIGFFGTHCETGKVAIFHFLVNLMHLRFRHYISLSVAMTLFVNTYGKGADS